MDGTVDEELVAQNVSEQRARIPPATRALFGGVWVLNTVQLWIYEGVLAGSICLVGGLFFFVLMLIQRHRHAEHTA